MSSLTHCQECGRRLTDVVFCPRCGEWFCCTACLAVDLANTSARTRVQNDTATSPCNDLASLAMDILAGIQLKALVSQYGTLPGSRRQGNPRNRPKAFQEVQTYRLGEKALKPASWDRWRSST